MLWRLNNKTRAVGDAAVFGMSLSRIRLLQGIQGLNTFILFFIRLGLLDVERDDDLWYVLRATQRSTAQHSTDEGCTVLPIQGTQSTPRPRVARGASGRYDRAAN